MDMKKLGILAVIVIAIVAIGFVVVWVNRGPSPPAPSSTPSSTTAAMSTITYSSNGFSPSVVTVQSGDTVAVKNATGSIMQLASNPHPVHTDDVDLNVGLVNPGQTKTFIVTKKGTFGYHNHLAASDTGQIVIK